MACPCRYCESQIRKNRRDGQELLGYCPRLLFSTVKSNVQMAIDALIKKPSNQLRVFQNGELVPVSQFHKSHELAEIICNSQLITSYIQLQHDLIEGIDYSLVQPPAVYQYKAHLRNLPDELHHIPDYLRVLMAMSLRDCSLMVNIASGRVNFIDLDPKPLDKLYYYLEEIQKHG